MGFSTRRTAVAAGAFVLALAGFASTGDAEAASEVRCGDRITRSVTLTKDLHCKKDGLKIGAHGITLGLGGHTIFGPGKPGTKGIQNSGYDHVVIVGGTVRGFDRGIELRNDARGNEVLGMHVRGGHYALVMFDSHEARVDANRFTAGAARDGYNGGFGAAVALYQSHGNWFEELCSHVNGVNGIVLEGSNDNGITDTEAAGFGPEEFCNGPGGPTGPGRGSQGNGLLLRNSDRNLISGNIFADNTKDGVFIDSKSTDNQLGGVIAVNNGRLGINLQGTAIVVSANRAFGNGWKAQCRGIVCAGK